MTNDKPTEVDAMDGDEFVDFMEEVSEATQAAADELEALLADPDYEPTYDREKLEMFVEFSQG